MKCFQFVRLLPLIMVLVFVSRTKAAATPDPLDAVHVYLITVGPGPEVFDKFGHNMIRVVGPAAALGQSEDIDVAFNWGEFSFEQPHFIWHFIQGRMLYWSGDNYYPDQFAGYKEDDRSTWQQELNLTVEQKQRLWQLLVTDVDDANKYYRYDYYRDNCATRARDALDEILNGQIRSQLESTPSDTTYRWHTRRLMQCNFWLYTALQYVLGHPTDQKIDAWQECFLPVQMMHSLERVTVKQEDGRIAPLVLNEKQIFQSSQYIESDFLPKWFWIYTTMGVLLAAIFLLPCFVTMRWWLKIPWSMLAMGWCMLGGVAGSILLWLNCFTDHVASYRNENILQLSVVIVPLIVLVPFAAWGKRWALKLALLLAGVQALLNIIGLLLKFFPAFNQPNWEIIALALPANVALVIGLAAMSKRIQSVRHAR
jgi:Domain of unknown function (DUF4105)